MAHSENDIEYGGTPKVAPVCAERHAKFKAYWESIGKPVLACRDVGYEGEWNKEAAVNWHDHRDYHIAGDPHWELRREWVDSDFTLPIEMQMPGGNISGPVWMLVSSPSWDPEAGYRKAEAKKADQSEWIAYNAPKHDANFASVKSSFPNDELGVKHPMYPIFMDAIEQATGGKGQRHGGARTPFLEQPWHQIAKHTGFRGLVFQAVKKAQEACGKDDYEAFEREMLGSMVYASMALIHARKYGYTKEVKVDESEN